MCKPINLSVPEKTMKIHKAAQFSEDIAIRRFKRHNARRRHSGRKRMDWNGQFHVEKIEKGYCIKFIRSNGLTIEMLIYKRRKDDRLCF